MNQASVTSTAVTTPGARYALLVVNLSVATE